MDQEIISRLRNRIVNAGLDAIIAISPENVTYVSGFVVPSQSLMRWRHAACIVTADGKISMVAIDMEATTVKAHAGIGDLRIYREFSDDPMEKLAEALTDLRLDRAKVAIEMEFLPAKDFATLQRKLPSVNWLAADGIFNKARQIQDAERAGAAQGLEHAYRQRYRHDALRSGRMTVEKTDLPDSSVPSDPSDLADYFPR